VVIVTNPTSETVPPGVIAVYVHEGRVVAHAADFNRSTPGGFTVREAQESRVHMSLAHAVVRECCSRLVSDNLDSYECERILNKLPGKAHLIPIGHEDKDGR
jgi:hypothetical protein